MTRVAFCSIATILAVLAYSHGAKSETFHVQTVTPKVTVHTQVGTGPTTGNSKNSIHIESFSFGSSQDATQSSVGKGAGSGKVDVNGIDTASGKRQHKPITLNSQIDPALSEQYQLKTNGH